MIELMGVSKYFGGQAAVNNLDLVIPKGAFCVLVGSSGCGKSTTLRMINKLLPHDAGRIRIDGQEINAFNEQTLRRRIGYAIQNTGLFPHWTVAQNIALVPQLLKWDRARIDARVDELMALLNLNPEQFRNQYPRQLSGGQAQRVGVARALAGNPDILLMDEPFGALDPITRNHLQDEMLRIQAKLKKTIVFVTHDMDEALRLATHIVVMDQGQLVQMGSPEQLLRNPINAYVASLMNQAERGLKLAGMTPLSPFIRPLKATATDLSTALLPQHTVRHAISHMLWLGVPCLPIQNDAGQLIGEVQLVDLVTANDASH
jgi:osmoprotectant transport system ATP-binding protein